MKHSLDNFKKRFPEPHPMSDSCCAVPCEICGLLVPGYAFRGCDLIFIPHELALSRDVNRKVTEYVHRYCSQTRASGPITAEDVAECHSVIQPRIERTPDAHWETEEKAG